MNMYQDNIIDLVIQKKQYKSYKMISRGKFSASIEKDYQDKKKKSALLIMTKNELESKKFDFRKIQNQYTIQALPYEYMTQLQTYIFHTTAGEYTLQNKIEDTVFRKSPHAIETVCNWIRDISLGLKKIHSSGYVHLNVHSSTIMITSDNRALIGGLNFARHSTTENNRFEIGSGLHYHPPEVFSFDTYAIDGEAIDTWCLAILTVESLTASYITRKTKQVTPWPKIYATLHKILQGPKFNKIVKKAYPKSAKEEHLEHVLHLMKHTLKFSPRERPKMSEFSLLMMELGFLKRIDKKLNDEHIWIKKVSLNELEIRMLNMALKKRPFCASMQTRNKFGKECEDTMLANEIHQSKNVHFAHPRSQTTLRSRTSSYIGVQNEYKIREKKVILPEDEVLSKTFPENLTVKKQDIHIPKKNENNRNDGMSGDFVSDGFDYKSKETEAFSFEHRDLYDSPDSSSGKEILNSERLQIVKPDQYEKPIANKDLQKSTDAEKQISKQEKQSEIFATDISKDNIHITQKQADLVACKTEKYLNECHKENTSDTCTSKWIFSKMINWVLEDILYAGVMQSGSFISKLSKDLTG